MALKIDELPSHLMLEILTSGRLSAVDLACLELASTIFRGSQGLYPLEFRSVVDLATAELCGSHAIFGPMSSEVRKAVFDRCGGRVQILSKISLEMQIKAGRYHTLLVSNSSVYSCGSNLCGVLGQGSEMTVCII